MKVKDYEYIPDIDDEDEVEITTERKEILISKLKDKIVREHIALYQILDIGNNNQEINFCYKWPNRFFIVSPSIVDIEQIITLTSYISINNI